MTSVNLPIAATHQTPIAPIVLLIIVIAGGVWWWTRNRRRGQ